MISEDLVLACATMAENDLKFLATLVPQTPDELHLYIKTHYGYTIPRVAVCEGHCSPFKALSDAFFGHSLDCLWVGPRTGGKTLQYAVLDHLMMKHFGTTIANIGAIEEQAKKCYGYIRGFLNLPQFRDDVDGESLMSSTSFTNGAKVEILPATLGRVNSPHPERAHWDEIELTDWKIIQEGLSFSLRTKVNTKHGEKQISSIQEGDIVECRLNGKQTFRRVVWAGQTGYGRIVRLELSNGRTLEATASHEVLTPHGWRAVEALAIGDRLVPGMRHRDVRQEDGLLPNASTEARERAASRYVPDVRRAEEYHFEDVPTVLHHRSQSNATSEGRNSRGAFPMRVRESSLGEEGRGARGCSSRVGLPSRHTVGCSQAVLGDDDHGSVRIVGISEGAVEPVYDIGVEEAHNFVAEGVVVHNSMPVRTNGRPPATIYTSSRKKAYGPMEILLEQAAEARLAGSEGLKTYFWCVFEIIERCPPERHQNGAKEGCGSCQLQDVCRPKLTDPYGNESFAPGPGKAARARGWMAIDDVITKFIRMDRGVFDAQWLSLRPETGGLAYPMFDEHVHVIDYTYNSAFPVVCGIDFGYTNPSVALYAQPTPSDDVVIFAEDYASGRTADVFAQSMMRESWFNNTAWRSADTAAAGDRATLTGMGVENEPADKSSSIMDLPNVLGGIALCRWALRPMGRKRPILHIARSCKNTIREIKKYHTPDQKEDKNAEERPVKSDDHAMDAMRYMMVRLYRGMLNV